MVIYMCHFYLFYLHKVLWGSKIICFLPYINVKGFQPYDRNLLFKILLILMSTKSILTSEELILRKYVPWHDKTNKMAVHPAKTQISLGIRPVWSECVRMKEPGVYPLIIQQMPRLIWVFAGRTLILLILSCCGKYVNKLPPKTW